VKRAKKKASRTLSITPNAVLSGRGRSKGRPGRELDPNRTAHHEAGHVVVAYALGLHTAQVTVERGEGYLGQCVGPGMYGYQHLTRRGQSRLAYEQAVAFYADLATEHHFCGVEFSFEDGASHGAWNDNSQAVELMRQHHLTKNLSAAVARAQREARRLVRKHSDAIARFATLLCKRRTLRGAELQALLEKLVNART
jgi:ATP-dependent Zn protease